MANKFQQGDVVVLKSGGPPMTVDTISPARGDLPSYEYACRWFKGATAARGSYTEHLLDRYVAPKK